MKPTPSPVDDPQLDLFRTELASIIDLKHPLAKLASGVDWSELEKVFGESYCEDNGRSAISTRRMVALSAVLQIIATAKVVAIQLVEHQVA